MNSLSMSRKLYGMLSDPNCCIETEVTASLLMQLGVTDGVSLMYLSKDDFDRVKSTLKPVKAIMASSLYSQLSVSTRDIALRMVGEETVESV